MTIVQCKGAVNILIVSMKYMHLCSLQTTISVVCSTFPSYPSAYKREQKGKRVAAADRRKQKAVASQAAATTDPQIPPVPTTSQTTQVSVEPSTAANVDSSSGGVGMVSVSDGVRAEGMDSCGPARDDEAMETDTVVEQTGVGSATAVTSVS